MRNPGFVESMTVVESATWITFSLVVKNFLGNTKADHYKELVEDVLFNFQNLEVKMSIKVHYLFCHLNKFPENLGDLGKEQEERFHQDIKVTEERYQRRWNTHMKADYCWNLQHHRLLAFHTRKSYKRRFASIN